MSDYVLGVDPGLSGAIALLKGGEYVEVWDMPTMGRGSGNKQQINAAAVGDILRGCPPCRAYIELVGAMPKFDKGGNRTGSQGSSSTFNFGKATGACYGALAALQIPMVEVTPQKWKKRFSLTGKEKDVARTYCQLLMPTAPLLLKKHGGRADALLIGLYGWQTQG